MTAAVIQAEYADYKRVKGRKVLQLICEVPIEQAPDVHKLFGEPAFGERQINVAIAKLDMVAVQQQPEKPKGKSYAQQAGICCNEPAFRRFLTEREHQDWPSAGECTDAAMAARTVRFECGVKSRSELIDGTEAGHKWRTLWLDYQNWLKE